MRFLVLAAILLQTLLTVSGGEVPFETCDLPVFVPKSVIINPYPVKLAGELVVEIKGVTNLTVTGGTFEYEISYIVKNPFKTFYLKIDEAVEDLCHRASCPIEPGHVMFEYKKKKLPPTLVPGLYRVQIKAKTSTGMTLLCLCADLDFVFPFQHEKQPLIT